MILGFFLYFNTKPSIVMHSTNKKRNRYHTFKILNFSSQFPIKVALLFSVSSSPSLLGKLCYHTFDQIEYKVLKSIVIISNKHITVIGKYKIWHPDSMYQFFLSQKIYVPFNKLHYASITDTPKHSHTKNYWCFIPSATWG